jgi:hypothetical protein
MSDRLLRHFDASFEFVAAPRPDLKFYSFSPDA